MTTTTPRTDVTEYVTVMIGGQLFGLPISRVQDVFMPERADARAAGAAGDRRRPQSARPHRHRDRHAPPARSRRRAADGKPPMAVGIELKGESYGLLIDAVGEVMKLPTTAPRGQSGQSRPAAGARLRAACIGSKAS